MARAIEKARTAAAAPLGQPGGVAAYCRSGEGEPLMPQGSADQLQSIPMSPNLSQSFARARDFAREQNHRALLLEHLLLALTEDPEAAGVLRACSVDTTRLSTDVSGYLGRLTEDMRAASGTEPAPDAELLRVIEAARQAAQQSPRKVIDGAVVLAAIVGDGKSPAAGLLKTHGMTFEEAIKTLQKASARARTKQYSTTTVRTQPDPVPTKPASKEPVREPAAPAASTPATGQSPSTPPTGIGPGQTVDDFLAAARARIQQRTAAAAPRPEPEAEPTPTPEPPRAPPDRPPPSLSSFSASSAPTSHEPAEPPLIARPPPPGGPPSGGPGGGGSGVAGTLGLQPMPAGASPAPPLPPGPMPTDQGLPPRAFQKPAGDGGPRPPVPRWPESAARGGDRVEAAEPVLNPRLTMGAGPLAGQRRADPGRSSVRPAGPPTRGAGQRPVAGPLVETIPRRMRVGTAALAQVRIGRDKVESLMQLLAAGRTPPQAPDTVVARVLSVRLLAPDGGFVIDAETAETQWIEVNPSQPQEEAVTWRWAVTPLHKGRHRLQLAVAARVVSRDGIGPEAYPPDRFIEITARANPLRRLVRWSALILLFAAGLGLGRLSHDTLAQDLADILVAIWRNVVGLLVTSGFLPG